MANPKVRHALAWVLLVGSMIGWPVSALWLAKTEPQFVLGLSWLALTLTALDILATTDIRVQHEEDDSPKEGTCSTSTRGGPQRSCSF